MALHADAECCYADCHPSGVSQFHCAECLYADCLLLSFVVLSVAMPSVVMQSVVMLYVMAQRLRSKPVSVGDDVASLVW